MSHLWSEAQKRGEKAREVVHGDVPEEGRKLGCISKQVPQDGHSQLHCGGRVLGLKSNNTPSSQPHLHGHQEEIDLLGRASSMCRDPEVRKGMAY